MIKDAGVQKILVSCKVLEHANLGTTKNELSINWHGIKILGDFTTKKYHGLAYHQKKKKKKGNTKVSSSVQLYCYFVFVVSSLWTLMLIMSCTTN